MQMAQAWCGGLMRFGGFAGLNWQMVMRLNIWLNTIVRPHFIHAAIESHVESLGFGQLRFVPWQPWHSLE